MFPRDLCSKGRSLVKRYAPVLKTYCGWGEICARHWLQLAQIQHGAQRRETTPQGAIFMPNHWIFLGFGLGCRYGRGLAPLA